MRWRSWMVAAALTAAGCGSIVRGPAPSTPPVRNGVQLGVASWYGPGFHGNRTANGEIYDQYELTAAHRTLPLGTRAMVTNMKNGRAVEVRINDRGPFVDGRVIDLSYAAARSIGMIGPGTAPVKVEVLGKAKRAPAHLVEAATNDLPSATYVIQVAALGDGDKAEHLRRVLASRFPEAFVSELAASEGGRYFRVRIGPYPLRGVAVARAELVSRLGYPAIIVENEAE